MKISCPQKQSVSVLVPQPVWNNQVFRHEGRISGHVAVSVVTDVTVVVAPISMVLVAPPTTMVESMIVDATSVEMTSVEATTVAPISVDTTSVEATRVEVTKVDPDPAPTSVDTAVEAAVADASQIVQTVLVDVIKTVDSPMLVITVVEPPET